MQRIRPANMRTTHGIQHLEGGSALPTRGYSVSAVQCVEGEHLDHLGVAASGGGMDAPEELPIGSVKAFFREHSSGGRTAFGFCQRTAQR
jgi:hypothetical protein